MSARPSEGSAWIMSMTVRALGSEAMIEVRLELAHRAPTARHREAQRLRANASESCDVGGECVDCVLGHLTIGSPLPARDVHDAVTAVAHAVSTRKIGRALAERLAFLGREQGP